MNLFCVCVYVVLITAVDYPLSFSFQLVSTASAGAKKPPHTAAQTVEV